jgi:hypothetical protein
VVIKRRQARERSGLPPIELAEIGHSRQYKRCGTCTDSGTAVTFCALVQRVRFDSKSDRPSISAPQSSGNFA